MTRCLGFFDASLCFPKKRRVSIPGGLVSRHQRDSAFFIWPLWYHMPMRSVHLKTRMITTDGFEGHHDHSLNFNYEDLSNIKNVIIDLSQESMKVREVIPRIGPIPIVIPFKLFLDLLRHPVFPRGLTDSQSYVPIFANDANHCVGIRSAVNIAYQLTLVEKPGSRGRSKNNVRGITMGIGPI